MHRSIVLAVLAAALLGACATPTAPTALPQGPSAAAATPAGGAPVIQGTVTAGPVCPVEQDPPDPACAPRPVAGAVIVATDGTGAEVCRATTAADGTYELVFVETGTVLVSAEPVTGLMGVPEPVAIELAGRGPVVLLDLEYDTGIR